MKKYFFIVIIIWCSIASAQNVLLNSSFELWLDSVGIRMPFGWYTSEPTDSGSATRTTDMHSGIYAIKLTGSDTLAYAMTLSICVTGHNYYFSGWCKSTSLIAGSFVITWLKLSQQPIMDPVIIPIFLNTSYHNYTQMVQAPDSAVLVNVDILALPNVTIYADDITLRDTVIAGIEEQQTNPKQNFVKIYPNPCNEQVRISVGQNSNSLFNRIDVCDIAGNIVKSLNQPQYGKISLNTKELAPGIFFLRVGTIKGKTTYKLIVQR
jgi:hypothetical protein